MGSLGTVLIDLDRTLINEDYQLTSTAVSSVIQRKQEEGWTIGLNSDTPSPTLFWWWEKLGMHGPIISEKGAEAWFPEDDAVPVYTASGQIVAKSKIDILSAISSMSKTMLIHGDATAFVRGIHELPGVLDTTLVAFNGLRKYSIAFFVRRIDRETGQLELDNDLAEKVVEDLRIFFPRSELLTDGEFDSEYGFFYINPSDVDKGSGALRVFTSSARGRWVVIGDSMADFVHHEDVEHLAVGNAYHDFKSKAQRVAEGTYTQGVIELLEQL